MKEELNTFHMTPNTEIFINEIVNFESQSLCYPNAPRIPLHSTGIGPDEREAATSERRGPARRVASDGERARALHSSVPLPRRAAQPGVEATEPGRHGG